MYCILVTGIPAAGKSTMAQYLAERLAIPVISKDRIKELLFDTVGFESRAEKARLGVASTNIMYYLAEQLMKRNQPFILENNFESASKAGLDAILEKYAYQAITLTLTGDDRKIYERFLERNLSPDRHRGHVVNDRYPEKEAGRKIEPLSFEQFMEGIRARGMDSFVSNGPHMVVDTTDFQNVDLDSLVEEIRRLSEKDRMDR